MFTISLNLLMKTREEASKDSSRAASSEARSVLEPEVNKPINVALFCGGRGSASLISEFLRWPQVHLSLIVNGYDDGLSTGHLRDLVPNMLGPSDFRKNLSRLIDLHSTEQYALQKLLEYRFSDNFSSSDIRQFEEYVEQSNSSRKLPAPLHDMMQELHPKIKQIIIEHLRVLLRYHRENKQTLVYCDCSFGNLVFAGAYLKANTNFNASVKNLTDLFRSSAQVVNVTRGENRVLVALKADGQILARESEVVGPQSASPILDIFLLESSLDPDALGKLALLSVDEKLRILKELEGPVCISSEADYVLRHADVIVYGPGTQFSSLLPSYKTIGLAESLQESTAKVKLFVCNIEEDHDIQGKTASGIVDTALSIIGDPENTKRYITHVLCNDSATTAPGAASRVTGDVASGVPDVSVNVSLNASLNVSESASLCASSNDSATNPATDLANGLNAANHPANVPGDSTRDRQICAKQKLIPLGEITASTYKSAAVLVDDFESKGKPGTHTGYEVVRRVIDLYESSLKRSDLRTLDIYVDLRDRSRAVNQLLQEFADIPWTTQFEHVNLSINYLSETEAKLPDYATLQATEFSGLFTEVDALSKWLTEGETDYLVTLTGDGEYRLADILIGMQVLRLSLFGALYGSRTQSRNQFRSALDSAYGESPLLLFFGFLGAFFFTAVLGLLFRQIYSDPFTGFRIYRRSKMKPGFIKELRNRGSVPSSTVTRLMLRHRIEIAEIPVVYRTFCGFTKPGWRIKRALKNLVGLIG
jgi:2-phospho-L-lactate transferase/gluconeogenesis factor (CofD/UPF0052 family)